jgi:hypothetical protein
MRNAVKIVKAMGLEMRDLFPGEPEQRTLVAAYDYQDENGDLRYQIVRYNPKDFRARRPDGNGGWIYSVKDIQLVPYQLPLISKYTWVLGTEGEKDADVGFTDFLLPTTTNPFGAGKWRDQYAPYFAGKTVVLCPHRDDAGRKHMQSVACSLFPVAKKIRIIDLPFGKDLTEFCALGGTRKQLIALINAAPAVTAAQIESWRQVEAPSARRTRRQVDWRVDGRAGADCRVPLRWPASGYERVSWLLGQIRWLGQSESRRSFLGQPSSHSNSASRKRKCRLNSAPECKMKPEPAGW